ATWRAIRHALRERETWLVAGFIFFWTFSPSFGPAFLFYQTDTLGFDQQFIGHLGALSSLAGVAGPVFSSPPFARPLPPPPPPPPWRRHREHARLPPPPRPDAPPRHRHVLRLHRNDPPAVHPRPARQVLPAQWGGAVLPLPHARVQGGPAAAREGGRPPLRQL